MRMIILVVFLLSLALVVFRFKQEKNVSKSLISLASFALIIGFAIMGNLTRPILPLFLAHIFLLVLAWGSVIWYLLRGKYYWWIIVSPLVTLALFFGLEYFFGQANQLPL